MTARLSTTPGGAVERVSELADLLGVPLTRRTRRWVVGWLVGAMARGLPVPGICALLAKDGERGDYSSGAVYLEWDLAGGYASLECGPSGDFYWWCTDNLDDSDAVQEATVTLDGPTTARIVTILRWLEAA